MDGSTVKRKTRGPRATALAPMGKARLASRIAFAPAAAAIAIACAGCASAAPDDVETDVRVQTGSSETEIFGGAKDDDAESIGGVVALRVGTGGTFELCTGALLAPNVVLTARHCVTKNATTSVSCDEEGRSANGKHVEADEDPQAVGVYVGSSPNFAQKPTSVARAVVAPKGPYLCDSDIALVVLATPIDDVAPLPVRLSAAAQPGERIRSVGYGQNDMKVPIGTRFRRADVEVLAQGKAVSSSRTPLGPHEFEVGRSICQGDSGGPAISQDTGAVIGVVSRGGGCDDDFGHIYTTTSGFDALFDEAFAVAGAQPVREAGATVHPRSTTEPTASDDATSGSDGSCALAPGRRAPVGAGAALGLLIAGTVVLRRRLSDRRGGR